jgi:hypothetical protein
MAESSAIAPPPSRFLAPLAPLLRRRAGAQDRVLGLQGFDMGFEDAHKR